MANEITSDPRDVLKEKNEAEEPKTEESVEEKETPEEVPEKESGSKDVDYKAELQRLREERDKYKDLTTKQRVALRDERKKRREIESSDEDDETETPKADSVTKVIRQELDQFRKEQTQTEFESLLESSIENPDERELVRDIYENDLRQSGSTRDAMKRDIEKARILANRDKYLAEARERAEKSVAEKAAVYGASGNVRAQRSEEKTVNLSASERRFLKRVGGLSDKQIREQFGK